MFEKDKFNILDCLSSIHRIENYVSSVHSLDEFESNNLIYDAVLMNFIVIAECCERLTDTTKEKYSNIDWRSIKSFRNFITHDYFGLDLSEI
jgi:uncharacterized protein with HEPN domain